MDAEISVPADWWRTFYDDNFAAARLRADGAVEAAADFLVGALSLRTGDCVFDQCCGTGRVGHALARRGMRVIGVDANPRYVAQARAIDAGTACDWFAGDAFTFVTPTRCRAAFNWFTSFGFSAHDADNLAMLRCAQESLAANGMFALETFHAPHLLENFRSAFTERFEADGRALEVERTSRIDAADGTITQVWRYRIDGAEASVQRSKLRLYAPRAVTVLLQAAGFTEVVWFGGIDGRPLTADCGRAVVVARKAPT